MKIYPAFTLGLILAIPAGCGNKDEPKTAVPAPLATPQVVQPSAVTPPPVPPKAIDDGIQRPTPGQANDDSSPAFKNGGKPDPKK